MKALRYGLKNAIPHGRSLPDDAWRRRHRAILALLWLHAGGLSAYAVATSLDAVHALGHGLPVAALALGATWRRPARKLRAAMASVGLLTASALLVHQSGGLIEAHFHFFVMVAVITLYEDWMPFLLAFGYVVVHHGTAGVLDAGAVYNHADAQAHPWRWAVIHGVFVVAAGAANVVTWRLNEEVRAAQTRDSERRAHESEERFRSIFDAAPLGITICDLDGRVLETNRRRQEMLGFSAADLRGMTFAEFQHPDSVADTQRLFSDVLAGRRDGYRLERLDPGPNGDRWVNVTVSLARDAAGAPQYVIGIVEDISERKRAAEERDQLLEQEQEQVRKLRELDRLKDAFVASVSHELRTPLTSIRGYLELVREGEAGELTPDQDRFLEIVDRNADRLLRVVGDLLFVAQVDAGTISLDRGDVDICALASEAVDAAQPLAAEKDVSLRLDTRSIPALHGDAARLAQVLDNLVSNAIKFTPVGGHVDVRTFAAGGAAVIEVADTGMGIRAEEQQRLFQRFFRATAATEHAIQGTGLGLAIAKSIVDGHGGRITVESAEGGGATFRVELPLYDPGAAATAAAPAAPAQLAA